MGKFNPAAAKPNVDHRDLIDALGGPTKVAAIIKVRTGHVLKPQAVSNWRSRGIPFAYRAALALEAGSRDMGVPANFLGDLAPEPEPIDAEVPFLG